jgi:GNAT superfamily N-acetyltransferase
MYNGNMSIRKFKEKEVNRLFHLALAMDLYYSYKSIEEDWKTKTYITHTDILGKYKLSQKHIEKRHAWMYEQEDAPIAYITINLFNSKHHNFPNSVFISELFVLKEYRGKGIGKKLVKHVLAQEFPKQYKYFSVTHTPEIPSLTKFYQDLGFKYQGETDAGNVMLIKNI